MLFKVLSASLSLACVSVFAPASAQESGTVGGVVVHAPGAPGLELKAERVPYGDLNLGTAAGAETMVGRISGAAKRVCLPLPNPDIRDQQDYHGCRTGAEAGAVQSLNAPEVTAVYEYKRKPPPK